jgi:hypothetical protein
VSAYATEPVSPELVLVSPPEIASLARAQLRETPFVQPVRVPGTARPSRLEYGAVYAMSLLMTVGPLAFIVQSTP